MSGDEFADDVCDGCLRRICVCPCECGADDCRAARVLPDSTDERNER